MTLYLEKRALFCQILLRAASDYRTLISFGLFLEMYKRESKVILHILCFTHWSGPNYFFHTWHINFLHKFFAPLSTIAAWNTLLLMLNTSIASKHYCNLLSRVLKVYWILVNKLGKALCALFDKELVYGARDVITILTTKKSCWKVHFEEKIFFTRSIHFEFYLQ